MIPDGLNSLTAYIIDDRQSEIDSAARTLEEAGLSVTGSETDFDEGLRKLSEPGLEEMGKPDVVVVDGNVREGEENGEGGRDLVLAGFERGNLRRAEEQHTMGAVALANSLGGKESLVFMVSGGDFEDVTYAEGGNKDFTPEARQAALSRILNVSVAVGVTSWMPAGAVIRFQDAKLGLRLFDRTEGGQEFSAAKVMMHERMTNDGNAVEVDGLSPALEIDPETDFREFSGSPDWKWTEVDSGIVLPHGARLERTVMAIGERRTTDNGIVVMRAVRTFSKDDRGRPYSGERLLVDIFS